MESQWKDMDADPVVIIGGYESGIDTALVLAKQDVPLHVLDRNDPWNDKDPGRMSSSPRTRNSFPDSWPIRIVFCA